jgi:hypothetical protein
MKDVRPAHPGANEDVAIDLFNSTTSPSALPCAILMKQPSMLIPLMHTSCLQVRPISGITAQISRKQCLSVAWGLLIQGGLQFCFAHFS